MSDDTNDLWLEFVNHGLCGLCGQSGYIDTRGRMSSPAGVECGVLRFCICPNGRALRRATGGDLLAIPLGARPDAAREGGGA